MNRRAFDVRSFILGLISCLGSTDIAQQCHIDFVGAALRLCNLNTQHICEKDVSCVSEVVFHSKPFLMLSYLFFVSVFLCSM